MRPFLNGQHQAVGGALTNGSDDGRADSAGPRKYDAGDTGTIMPAADYAKFYEMLLAGGVSERGERILSHTSVQLLCKGRFRGLNLSPSPTSSTGKLEPHSQHGGLAAAMGVAGAASPFPRSFNFGWATSHGFADGVVDFAPHMHPDMSNWGGCAHTLPPIAAARGSQLCHLMLETENP